MSDVAAGTVYWTALSNSAGGALLREDLGNGLATLRTVDRASGQLEALTTGPGVSATVQNLAFDWDGAGNLQERRDLQANKKEAFDYDGLYRLSQARLYATANGTTPAATDHFTYDTIGNLTNKGGATGSHTFSNYAYGPRSGCANTVVRPHAVYQVTVGAGTRRYCYDANGNLTSQSLAAGSGPIRYDTSSWWVANLARRISQGTSAASEFWYGAGRERIRQLAQKSATTSEETRYVGGLYEKFTRTVSGTPSTEHVHYVRGGDQAIAVVKRISGSLQTRYLHRDHLGSVVALTDSGGAVVERYSYDPWGKRRDPATWLTPAPGTFGFDPTYTDRGYTGHEHVDHLGLVNMNGRIYDPELGKFLSADPTTQFPESTQGWNRYSYCGNNPLSYTDPSGFSFLKSVMMVVGIVMQFIPGLQGWTLVLWQKLLWAFASGYLASGGNLQGGLMTMATAGIGAWAGALARAGPAAAGATPNFNPSALTIGAAVEATGSVAAETTTASKILQMVVRSTMAMSPNDASARTNRDRKSENGADSRAYERLYACCGAEPGSRAAEAGLVLGRDPNIPSSVKVGIVAVVAVATVGIAAGSVVPSAVLVTFERASIPQDIAEGIPPGARAAGLAARGTTVASKIEGQLAKRGWSRSSVDDAISNPTRTVPTRDARHLPGGGRNNDPATAYYSRDGGYVVRNDITGDVVQVSNRNDPNWRAPWD